MHHTPKVSVLIPTYNSANFLDETIQSVLQQTFTDFELIIVDNRSTDNTQDVVAPYLTDTRVQYYKNAENIGMVGNWNKCLDYANGEYIKFLMADDKLHHELLKKFVTVLDDHPTVSIVTSNSDMFGSKNTKRVLPFTHLIEGKKVIEDTLKKNNNWIGEPSTVMFRKAALKGNFNPAYTCYVDWEMWLRLLQKGDCYIIPETLSYFRIHDDQVSKKVGGNYKFTFEDYRFFKSIKLENNPNINLQAINLDEKIKKKAAYCAKAMYKVLPYVYKSKKRAIFYSAFKIALAEKVIFEPLLQRFNKERKQPVTKEIQPANFL